MNHKRPDELDITESEYLDADLGPPEDTDVFHRRTPAPGERSHVAPVAMKTSSEHQRVPRISTGNTLPPDSRGFATSLPEVPVWMVLAGVLGGGSLVIVGGLLVWLAMPAPLEVQQTADTTEPTEEGKWQGLDVKKGLR